MEKVKVYITADDEGTHCLRSTSDSMPIIEILQNPDSKGLVKNLNLCVHLSRSGTENTKIV